MKKILLLSVLFWFVFCIVMGCSNKQNSDTTTINNQTTVQTETSANINDKNKQDTTKLSKTPLEKASVSSSDASKKISSLSMEQLGLKGKKEDYKFMVSTQGKEIGGEDYIEVIASKVKKENKDGSISMDTVGQYFISYDGKKMLIKDMETGKFSELK